MANSATSSLTGRVSNTNLGTVKRNKFVLELGEDNKPIKTSNIRVVAEVGTKFPASISSERIEVLRTIRSDLSLISTDYVLSTQGEFEADDYLESLTHGDMQLWIATEDNNMHSAMVTQIVPYPQKQILRVILIAGSDFKRLYEFNDMVESFAIKTGCSGMELWGRKGWKKLLPDWESNYIVYTKDLKHRMQ